VRAATDRGVMSTGFFPTLLGVVHVVLLLVEPVLDRFVRDLMYSGFGPGPDVLADRWKAVVFRIVGIGRAMTPGTAIGPFLSQLSQAVAPALRHEQQR